MGTNHLVPVLGSMQECQKWEVPLAASEGVVLGGEQVPQEMV